MAKAKSENRIYVEGVVEKSAPTPLAGPRPSLEALLIAAANSGLAQQSQTSNPSTSVSQDNSSGNGTNNEGKQ
jgi:hypothetical protein